MGTGLRERLSWLDEIGTNWTRAPWGPKNAEWVVHLKAWWHEAVRMCGPGRQRGSGEPDPPRLAYSPGVLAALCLEEGWKEWWAGKEGCPHNTRGGGGIRRIPAKTGLGAARQFSMQCVETQLRATPPAHARVMGPGLWKWQRKRRLRTDVTDIRVGRKAESQVNVRELRWVLGVPGASMRKAGD